MNPESRKIQLTGGSTYIVSLPKDWVRSVGLEAGDTVAVWPHEDGTVVIDSQLAKGKSQKKSVVIIDGDMQDHLLRKLIGLYIAGHGLIELKSRGRMSPEIRQVIREFVRKVIGPEIVDESADSVILQDLLDPTDLPMTKTVRRMYLIASSMLRDSLLAMKELDVELAEDVVSRDDEIDRLYWLVAKQFNIILKDARAARKTGMTSAECLSYRIMARTIERIADHAARIARNVSDLAKEEVDSALLLNIEEYGSRALEMFDKAVKAMYGKDTGLANMTVDTVMESEPFGEQLVQAISKDAGGAVPLAYVVESIDRIASYSSDIAETVINHVALGS